jgi:hypothetical protein
VLDVGVELGAFGRREGCHAIEAGEEHAVVKAGVAAARAGAPLGAQGQKQRPSGPEVGPEVNRIGVVVLGLQASGGDLFGRGALVVGRPGGGGQFPRWPSTQASR